MSTESVALGAPFPEVIAEGAMFDAFAGETFVLRIGMAGVQPFEASDYATGAVIFRVTVQCKAILTLWRFGRQPWLDAPFDAGVARSARTLDLPADLSVVNNHDVVVALVDTASTIVRALRRVPIKGPLLRALVAGIRAQLADPEGDFTVGSNLLSTQPEVRSWLFRFLAI